MLMKKALNIVCVIFMVFGMQILASAEDTVATAFEACYSFDDLTANGILTNAVEDYESKTYQGWYLDKADTTGTATSETVEGRKTVKIYTTNTSENSYKLRKSVNLTITDNTVIELDAKVGKGFKFCLNDIANSTYAFFRSANGSLTTTGGTLKVDGKDVTLTDNWFRFVLTFNVSGDSLKYNLHALNLDTGDYYNALNLSFPSGVKHTAITKIVFGSYGNPTTSYIDEFRITQRDFADVKLSKPALSDGTLLASVAGKATQENSAVIYLACYNKTTGELASLSLAPIENTEITMHYVKAVIPENYSDYCVRAFVWNKASQVPVRWSDTLE